MPLREWIAAERPRNEIKKRFKAFLNTFTENKAIVYHNKIVRMAQTNGQSLEIEIGHVIHEMAMIAAWIVEAPKDMMIILQEVTEEVVLSLFPDYIPSIQAEIFVRILDLPGTEKIRDLRTAHLNFLIKVSGVVTRRTNVFPQLKSVKYDCQSCGATLGPFMQQSMNYEEVKLHSCPECTTKGPFKVNTEETIYRNYQKITLQESPGSVPPGRVPRQKEVILLADLIDRARPGDEVDITGIYCNIIDPGLNMRQGFPVFKTIVEANYVEKRHDLLSSHILTTEDKRAILKLAKDPQIGERIVQSIAPSIYGHVQVKTGIALAMFGGKAKKVKNSRVRGDINLLLVGDPGTAKSQFLKYIEKTAPRAVYSTGKGASAVGLTAGVHIDPATKEWVLEGGALVLADKGVCLIDEFDKMNDGDRTSIHEAMEQQTISISKAGIVTSLQARCSVIAAANPIGGRYDARRTFAENVELTDPIIQRFDILCVLQDRVDPVEDERLADFVILSHMKNNPVIRKRLERQNEHDADDDTENLEQNTQSRLLSMSLSELNTEHQMPDATISSNQIISQAMLQKYIIYARMHVNPTVTSIDSGKIQTFYSELRRASQHTGAVPIAVRHIESLFRMAEAYARMHLRDNVRNDDIDMAIRVMTESLCTAQKYSFRKQWTKKFQHYIHYQQDNNVLLMHILQELFKTAHTYENLRLDKRNRNRQDEVEIAVQCSDFVAKAKSRGIHNVQEFYHSAYFGKHSFTLDAENKRITKLFTV